MFMAWKIVFLWNCAFCIVWLETLLIKLWCVLIFCLSGTFSFIFFPIVPAGSPSRGGDVTVFVWNKPTELAHCFLFRYCICFCLYDPFNYNLFHKFSLQLSLFSLCSSGLVSASLVLSTVFHSINSPDNSPFSHSVLPVFSLPYWSFQLHSPDVILCGRLGSKHQPTI